MERKLYVQKIAVMLLLNVFCSDAILSIIAAFKSLQNCFSGLVLTFLLVMCCSTSMMLNLVVTYPKIGDANFKCTL